MKLWLGFTSKTWILSGFLLQLVQLCNILSIKNWNIHEIWSWISIWIIIRLKCCTSEISYGRNIYLTKCRTAKLSIIQLWICSTFIQHFTTHRYDQIYKNRMISSFLNILRVIVITCSAIINEEDDDSFRGAS